MAIIRDRQNIFDLMLQESGGLNNTAQVLRNNGLNFNDQLISGSEIEIEVLESEKIKENYQISNFKPNNDDNGIDGDYIFEDEDSYIFEDSIKYDFD